MKMTVKTCTVALALASAMLAPVAIGAAPTGSPATPPQQQSTSVCKGVVNDSYGEPLVGATVLVDGTTNGVAADIDGNFSLSNVKIGSKITISYVGYESQTVVWEGTPLNITLKEAASMLDEVVAIGYGSVRKKDLTGAVVQINPDKIADQNPSSVQDLLRGTPGLQIGYDASAKGQDASIVLRGKNSLGTDASPLIVLDGMAFNGELSEINPDDIAQIDVLKDASSAAIYGSKAAAGVIIITTKKGKSGKPIVTVSANLAVNRKSAYSDYFTASQYLKYRQDYYKMVNTYGQGEDGLYGYYNAGAWTNGKTQANASADGYTYDASKRSFPVGYYDDPRQMSSSEAEAWSTAAGTQGVAIQDGESYMSLWARRLYMGPDIAPYVYQNFMAGNITDWNDLTFRTGLNQDYNASVSGATDNMNYYMSFGYMKNEGAVMGNDYRAYRGQIKLTTDITPWLQIGGQVNFQDRTDGDIQVSLGGNYWDSNMLRNSPYASLYDETGEYAYYPMSGISTNGGYNYYAQRQYYELDKGYTVLNTMFNAKVTLPYGFTYQFNIAPRFQWFHDRYWMSADEPNVSAASTGVNRETRQWFDWNLNNTITWDKYYNKIHHITVTLVQEAEEHRYWQDRIYARNITPTDALGYHYVSGADMEQSSIYTYDSHYTAASYLGRAFYSFNNRYMITGTFRRDGYSGFGKNNQWGNFGSVGLGWMFSEESFMKNFRDWLDLGKLRLSYGTNGNREFGDVYKTLANLSVGSTMVYDAYGTDVKVNSLKVDRLANPDLEWEKTHAYNFGLDLGFLNNRLMANIDLYYKDTKDMIMSQRLPSFSGFSSITTNLGEVTNKGIEISLTSQNIIMDNFTWSTTVGFSYNKNKIKHIYYDYDEETGKENSDSSNGWYIGKPMGEIWNYEFIGVWQNTPEDIAAAALLGQVPGDPIYANHYTDDDVILEDGTRVAVYNDNDKVYQGTTTPPYYWNIRNEFTLWKDLTISFSLYSYMGHKYTTSRYLNSDNGGSVITNAFNIAWKEYWTPENPSNENCRIMATGPSGLTGGTSKVMNANFVRLDNISIGYTIPQNITRRFSVDKIRVSASCHNVCTFGGYKWADPETFGLATRTFNFGLNVTI